MKIQGKIQKVEENCIISYNIRKHINRLSVNKETKKTFSFLYFCCLLLLYWVENSIFKSLANMWAYFSFLITFLFGKFLFNKKHILQLISVSWKMNCHWIAETKEWIKKEDILRISCRKMSSIFIPIKKVSLDLISKMLWLKSAAFKSWFNQFLCLVCKIKFILLLNINPIYELGCILIHIAMGYMLWFIAPYTL